MGFVRAHRVAGVFGLVMAGLSAAALPGAARGGEDSDDGDPPLMQPAEVAHFVLDGDNLVVETGLAPGVREQKVRIVGMPGEAEVSFTARTRQREPRAILYYSLSHSAAAADGRNADFVIRVSGTSMTLVRTIRTPKSFHTVTLSQSRYRWNGDGDGTVNLSVRSTRSDTGQVVDDVDLSAGTMAELLRDHPAECVEFLGPVFHDFGNQDGPVLGVSRPLTWQVFGDRVPPEDGLPQRVDALLARLNADSYRERQRAAAELERIGGPAAFLLRDRPRDALSAEQHAWLDQFVADHRPLPPEQVEEKRRDRNFLVRCFVFSDDLPVRRAAVEQLQKVMDRPVDLDPAAEPDGRLKALARLRTTPAKR